MAIIFLIMDMVNGQEVVHESGSWPYGKIALSYVLPFSYGNNFLEEGYDIKNGVNLDLKGYFSPNWFASAQINYFKGEVIDIEKIGAIENSRIFRIHALGGYSFDINKKTSIDLATGPGYVQYRHFQASTRFRDKGFSLSANASISYQLKNFIGIYLKMDHHWDFVNIDAAPEQEKFFRRTQLFLPSLGVAFYVY